MIEAISAIGLAGDDRGREVGCQMLADGDRPGAGAAAAVRAREGLVRVVMHQVNAHVARPDHSQDGIHVGAIEIQEAPPLVQQAGDRADLRVEQAQRVGVGHHEDSRLVGELGAEVVEIDKPLRIALDRHRLEPREVRRGGIRAVCAVGYQDLRTAFPPVAEVGGSNQERGQLALGARGRLKAHGMQPGDLGEHLLELV